ncbi:MAG: FCD domain-containing protein [Sphingomonas sp.]
MPKISAPSASLTQSAYEGLRTQLVSGALRPGAKLKISDLCQSLSANMSAVREALARLTSEGLVVAEPQRGFSVAPITADDLRHLTEVRVPLEEMCIRRSIALGDIDWEAAIVAALHGLLRTERYDETGKVRAEWAEAHNRLHKALVAACDNPWMLRLRENLATQGDRYRWVSVAASGLKRDLDGEHRRLADAFLSRDADLAVALMTDHIHQTTEVLLNEGLADIEGDLQPA